MSSENVIWGSIALKLGVLLFLAFLAYLIFKIILRQHQLRELNAELNYQRVQITTNILPIIVAILAGLAALWVAFSGGIRSVEVTTPTQALVGSERFDAAMKKIEILEAKLENLKKVTVAAGGSDDGKDFQQLAALVAESKTVGEENKKAITKFESLMLSEAENLLTLPLLKQEITAINIEMKSLKSEVSTLRSLMAESSNQNRWLIGTLALGKH